MEGADLATRNKLLRRARYIQISSSSIHAQTICFFFDRAHFTLRCIRFVSFRRSYSTKPRWPTNLSFKLGLVAGRQGTSAIPAAQACSCLFVTCFYVVLSLVPVCACSCACAARAHARAHVCSCALVLFVLVLMYTCLCACVLCAVRACVLKGFYVRGPVSSCLCLCVACSYIVLALVLTLELACAWLCVLVLFVLVLMLSCACS